ncbi:MAG: hypothetical protein FWG90_09605 [Oscillospiraceae bacterium]|nr:hypothetical protein [Oscillospiraceae bacterium]
MQDNNTGMAMPCDLSEKYKEEMMRLYKRTQRAAQETRAAPFEAAPLVSAAPEFTGAQPQSFISPGASTAAPPAPVMSSAFEETAPPLPPPCVQSEAVTERQTQREAPRESRFPPAGELIERALGRREANMRREMREEEQVAENEAEAMNRGCVHPERWSGTGILQVEVTSAGGALPVEGASVVVKRRSADGDYFVSFKFTDDSGKTEDIPLSAPPPELSLRPETADVSFSVYLVSVYKKGFYPIIDLDVPIFATVKSIQPVNFIPAAKIEPERNEQS